MLMIIPSLLGIISGIKWRITFAIPLTLVSITLSNSSASTSHIFPFLLIKPALFTANHIHKSISFIMTFLFKYEVKRKRESNTNDIRNKLFFYKSSSKLSNIGVRPLQNQRIIPISFRITFINNLQYNVGLK